MRRRVSAASSIGLVFLVALLWISMPLRAEEPNGSPGEIPVKNRVTLVDAGAKGCIPCKMMVPVMEEIEREYKDKAAIVIVDLWKNKELGKRLGVRVLPTQIFYDRDGKEVYRHEGFLDKKSIVAKLEELGVK